jgi:hypothetical protein
VARFILKPEKYDSNATILRAVFPSILREGFGKVVQVSLLTFGVYEDSLSFFDGRYMLLEMYVSFSLQLVLVCHSQSQIGVCVLSIIGW